ncbi:DUF58 domain-containing protein [Actinopolymorpha alba]|uniref:DUF58 domain-containing protein n=1 Tax=Actinopolymorpha alba TaxID=533267 RepID=UPI00037D6B45|nr:DUF58 domain-containing protein [Actinopolymorpha alba]
MNAGGDMDAGMNPAGQERALRKVELTVRRKLAGLLHGDYTGLRLGPGSEPDESRPYHPGQDDVRRMDWNVTARTLDPHVRAPIAEPELETWALVDASASMDFGTAAVEKRDLATAIVGAVALLADRPGNRLGVRIAYGTTLGRIPARAGVVATRRALRTLLALPRLAPGYQPTTDLARALTLLHKEHPRPGLRVVASDFLDGGERDHDGPPVWQGPLRRLATRHEVIAVEIIDPRELELPDVGLLTLVDPETGRRREVSTSSRRLRERYAAVADAHRAWTRAAFRSAGVAHLVLRTDRDWVRDVAAFAAAQRRAAARRPARPGREYR